MRVSGSEQVQNVVSLFETMAFGQEVQIADPITELMNEIPSETPVAEAQAQMLNRRLVLEEQFPDQSMHILDEQLKNLKLQMNRIKFYLDSVEDVLPVKNR